MVVNETAPCVNSPKSAGNSFLSPHSMPTGGAAQRRQRGDCWAAAVRRVSGRQPPALAGDVRSRTPSTRSPAFLSPQLPRGLPRRRHMTRGGVSSHSARRGGDGEVPSPLPGKAALWLPVECGRWVTRQRALCSLPLKRAPLAFLAVTESGRGGGKGRKGVEGKGEEGAGRELMVGKEVEELG